MTDRPASASSRVATSPASPPPMTMTSASMAELSSLAGRVAQADPRRFAGATRGAVRTRLATMTGLAAQATDPLPWDGPRLAAQLVASGPTRLWRSAFEEDLVTEIATSTPADVAAAAARARTAQVDWAARPLEQRQRLLLDFHDAVLDRRDALVDLLQYEGGKARLTAVEEVLHLALTARYYARTARQVLHRRRGGGMVPLLTRI